MFEAISVFIDFIRVIAGLTGIPEKTMAAIILVPAAIADISMLLYLAYLEARRWFDGEAC